LVRALRLIPLSLKRNTVLRLRCRRARVLRAPHHLQPLRRLFQAQPAPYYPQYYLQSTSSTSSSSPSSSISSTESSTSSLVPSTSESSTSTTQTSVSSTSSTSTSATATPTGTCATSLGCYTEAGATVDYRTLDGAAFPDFVGQIVECEKDCVGFAYFGVEYG